MAEIVFSRDNFRTNSSLQRDLERLHHSAMLG
jgi:hypothetical protein